MDENIDEKQAGSRFVYSVARGVAVVAAAFSLVVCILMIANYFQVKALDPLDSPALQSLLQQLEEDPENETLKHQIRSLDLLARKAYFTSKWQIKTGAFMLLSGVVLLLISLKIMADTNQGGPDQDGLSEPSGIWKEVHQARRGLLIGGAVLAGLALILGFLTQSDLDQIRSSKPVSPFPDPETLVKNWPNFRGPFGNAQIETGHPPLDWDGAEGRRIIWKAGIAKPGMSSPAVWKDHLFITGADASLRQVYCYRPADGDLFWQHDATGIRGSPDESQLPDVTEDTGLAAPSPATDGRYVLALFGTGDLICLDMEGSRIWAKNLGVPVNHYGHASSLIIYQDLVFVQYDQNENSKLYAFEVHSGQLKWEASRGPISWSSPICIDDEGRMELILTNSESADGYDPLTGEQLWHVNCLYGEVAPSAAYSAGLVFTANEYATASAIDISGHDPEPAVLWEWDEYLPNTSSPLAHDPYLILATADGFVNCLDTRTGTAYWEQEFDEGFYSSPIRVADRVYLMDLTGVMQIFRMDSTFELLGSPAIGEDITSTPAFVEDRIYIRGTQTLYCVGMEGEE
jgi:outer membrane protein assembly factor BamB